MSQRIDQIQEVLGHEHFDNIGEFPQVAEEENYTTEFNNTSLNESIAHFEQIVELLNTAIEKDIINRYPDNQLNNIRKKLINVRKEAQKLENRNSRRNNPGRDFIKQVENLRSYVIGQLALDLRAGDHLDFSEQLTKFEEIRVESQRTREELKEAVKTKEKINSIHKEISNQKGTIDQTVSSTEESQERIETIKTNVSNKLEDIRSESETVNERYEEVLKKTEQINEYENRLEDSLSEVEERSEQLSQQQDDLDEIEDRIDTLLSGAIAASLDRNFTERKDELERAAKMWAIATFAAIGILIGGAFFIFENITQSGGFGARTISRVTLLIPLLVGVWFTSRNYSQKRNLMEEYAFKSTMAQTLEPSRRVLESQESLDETDAQLAEFMLVSMGQMFTNPSNNVNPGNNSNEDDATNIETVMDLAKRISRNNQENN
ncbi:coiled-coil domain-containing protein [Halorubrum ezzemoulense]|uniref:hypothetical protein n=1 Tax=Halorubrum ezzemoulense TaxID=337243 RepID=UPI0011819AC0|nr:hypothetical protein [Halorubrum ezzemoulense]